MTEVFRKLLYQIIPFCVCNFLYLYLTLKLETATAMQNKKRKKARIKNKEINMRGVLLRARAVKNIAPPPVKYVNKIVSLFPFLPVPGWATGSESGTEIFIFISVQLASSLRELPGTRTKADNFSMPSIRVTF